MKDPRNEREACLIQDEGFARVGKQTTHFEAPPHHRMSDWDDMADMRCLSRAIVAAVLILALAVIGVFVTGGLQ